VAYYHQGDYYGRGDLFGKLKKAARKVGKLAKKVSPVAAIMFPTVAGPLAAAVSIGSKLGGGAAPTKRGISPVTPPGGAALRRRASSSTPRRRRRSYVRSRGDYGDDWQGNRPSRAKRSGRFLTRRGGRRRRRMTAKQRRYFGKRRGSSRRRRSVHPESWYLRYGEVGTDRWLEKAPPWLLRKHGFTVPRGRREAGPGGGPTWLRRGAVSGGGGGGGW
jgi:hypothetical protein